MSAPGDTRQEDRAIGLHTAQAELFSTRYEELRRDPYASCFSYGRHRLRLLLDRLLPKQGTGLCLLDVGCGTGHQLDEMHERGFKTTGVDGSAAMLEHARRLNPDATLGRAEVDALPFADACFDVILCLEVLRYLPQIGRCVGEMARTVRPGGTCFATASPLFNLNGYPLLNRLVQHVSLGRFVRLKQYFHTSSGLRKVFLAAGFREARVHGVYIGLINWVEKISPGRLPALLRRWEAVDAALADRPFLRDLSGMLLVHAVR
jgi:ubiquinone/menaquinone biosynthesis C-methylase UbiE